MNPYGTLNSCPKCRNGDISNSFHEEAGASDSCYWDAEAAQVEHIDRHCKNCHHVWFESPLDKDIKAERDPDWEKEKS